MSGPLTRDVRHEDEMITKRKLEEYIWAGGDIDGWSRSGRQSDITDEEWRMIDTMLTAITIIRRGLAADAFVNEHREMVQKNFDCEKTYKDLKEYELKIRKT